MSIREHYAALGASYNTLSTLKSVLKFSTIDETYQFWKHQKDAKDKKKQHLIDVSNQLGITEKAVRMRRLTHSINNILDSLNP